MQLREKKQVGESILLPGVGVDHEGEGQEVGHNHEGHIVPEEEVDNIINNYSTAFIIINIQFCHIAGKNQENVND